MSISWISCHCYIVAGANLDVSKVERLAIVGESGRGKTTAVSMLLRLIEPDSAEFEPRD
jgi:ABC-type glutathione transport system ATPase component